MVYLTFSVLLVALGVPLALGKVPPNPLYGFRTPATQNDPELWYPVNARTGLDLIGSGLVLGFVAWLLPRFVQMANDTYMAVWTTGIVIALLFVFLRGAMLLRKLQAERGEG